MTYEELQELSWGQPSIELINKYIREQEGISIFYKIQLQRDKRPYWKGKLGEAAKKRLWSIKVGKMIHGDKFIVEQMGLTESERQECIESNNIKYETNREN